MAHYRIEADDNTLEIVVNTERLGVNYKTTWIDFRNDINSAANWVRNGKRNSENISKRIKTSVIEELEQTDDSTNQENLIDEYNRSPFKKEHPLTGKRFA